MKWSNMFVPEFSFLKFFIRFPFYRFYARFNSPKLLPLDYNIMLTYSCNSRCKTCFIWKVYQKNPELKQKELKTSEYDKIFSSIGKNILWVTLGGGEPFLRKDLVKICRSLYQNCSPLMVHLLTNATLPKIISKKTEQILRECDFPYIKINLSLDAIGDLHDRIRGRPGNFKTFLLTYKELQKLKLKFPNLKIGIHSTLSRYNFSTFLHLYDFIKRLRPDTFMFEIAQERQEFLNLGIKPIIITSSLFSLIEEVKDKIKNDYLFKRRGLIKLLYLLSLYYYTSLKNILKKKSFPFSCYAGIASVQINPFGDVWPCAVLGNQFSFGNLRDYNYNFRRLFFSKRVEKIKRILHKKRCKCILAKSFYTSSLLHLSTYLNSFKKNLC